MMRLSVPVIAAAFLTLCAPSRATAVQLPDGFNNDVIVTGLNQPNSMAFLPDGRLLFTEQRTGRVRMVVAGHIAATDPVLTVTDIHAQFSEQGLQGIAVDPGWPARPYVYLFYNRAFAPAPPPGVCRLVRYTASGNLSSATGENLTLSQPLLIIDDIPDYTQWHQAGCLRFGPDGMLYVSLGDDDVNPCFAADSTSLRGQILRLDVSGLPPGPGPQVDRELITPPDNPLDTTDPNARMVWAYGVRNPWRFSIDPATGKMYVVDVGEEDYEEISEAEAGDFLGWPWREGYLIMPRPTCPEPGGEGTIAFREPLVAFGRGSELTAIFGGGVYRPVPGAPYNWPAEYVGNVFYGEYYSGFYRRLKLVGGIWGPAPPVAGQPNPTDWGTEFISAVDFVVGKDGSMWWLRQFDDAFNSSSGSIQRIRYGNETTGVTPTPRPGVALLGHPNPFTGGIELTMRLSAPGRVRLAVYDVSGRLLRVLWDGPAPVAETRVTWDGRDEDGRAVPAGVYLARWSDGGATGALRVLKLARR